MTTVNGGLNSDHPYRTSAREYQHKGWHPISLPYASKFPPEKDRTGWNGTDAGTEDIAEMMSKGPRNVAVRMPERVIGLDVDAYDGKGGLGTLAELERKLGPLPGTVMLTSRADGSGIRFYRIPGGDSLVFKGVAGPGIEIVQRRHRYAVAAPSVHPKGGVYRWIDEDGHENDEIPAAILIADLPPKWVDWLSKTDPRPGGGPVATADTVQAWLDDHDGWAPCATLAELLQAFDDAEGARHDAMLDVQIRIVNKAAGGHLGGTSALEQLAAKFEAALGGDRDGEWEFLAGLAGAIGRVMSRPPHRGRCCNVKGEIETRPPLEVVTPADFGHALTEAIGDGTLPGLFRSGNDLQRAHPIGSTGYRAPDRKGWDDGPAQVHPIDPDAMIAYLHRQAFVFKVIDSVFGRLVVETFAPRSSVVAALQHAPHDRRVPILAGVAHTPVMREDGTVLDEPGYDPGSGIIYMPHPDLKVGAVPASPTRAQVDTAAALLLGLVSEFPWVSDADRTNYLGALLAPLLRPVLPFPGPLVVITARMMGTGKSLLADLIGEVHGMVQRGEFPGENEELRKQLSSLLTNTTAPVVTWDNVEDPIGAGHLAKLLTSRTWTDRILGATKEVTAPTNRTFVVTGNSVQVRGDMARRVLWVRLDANMDKPWQREGFKIPNLAGYVAEHRGAILAALLTLIRGWYGAGCPTVRSRSDTFGPWFEAVGGVLTYARIGDVGQTDADRDSAAGMEDHELGDWLEAWRERFGAERLLARTAADACRGHRGGFSDLGMALPQALHDRFREGGYQAGAVTKLLGRWFAKVEGRWARGLVMRRAGADSDSTSVLWTVTGA